MEQQAQSAVTDIARLLNHDDVVDIEAQSAVTDIARLLNHDDVLDIEAQSAVTDIARLLNHDDVLDIDLRLPSAGEGLSAFAPAPSLDSTCAAPAPIVAAEGPADLPRPYQCIMGKCDKAFHRLEHLTRHIRTHTGEKPHACTFLSCSKRFSRSDELTRHLRIHSNPRRKGPHHAALLKHHMPPVVLAQAHRTHHVLLNHQNAVVPVSLPPIPVFSQLQMLSQQQGGGVMLPPPTPHAMRSAPSSGMSSPAVSPHLLLSLAPHPTAAVSPANVIHPPSSPASISFHPASDPNLAHLDRAVPRSHRQSAYYVQGNPWPTYGTDPRSMAVPSFTAALVDDHYGNAYRQPKRSRPNSPISTAPSSPALSQISLSPTPDQTPVQTPGPSPRLHPFTHFDLPVLRSLSIHQHGLGPQLTPLEPSLDAFSSQPPMTAAPGHISIPAMFSATAPRTPGISFMDLINRPDKGLRKLPLPVITSVPKRALQDVLSGPF